MYQAPSDANPQGHWTLPGGIDAPASGKQNNCFFDVIATTTSCDANKLREDTVQHLRDNIDHLASQVNDINRLSAYERNALQYGGASYMVLDEKQNLVQGNGEQDAKKIIDNSQGTFAPLNALNTASTMRSHPEGHRSNPNVPSIPGNIDSVESYSHGNQKTAFMNESDQLFALDRALQHPSSIAAMSRLNNTTARSYKEAVNISLQDLIKEFPADASRFNSLKAGAYLNGTLQNPNLNPIKSVTLVLRHHIPPPGFSLQTNDPVNLLTFFPRI